MDSLMKQQAAVNLHTLSTKKNAEQVDGIVAFARYQAVVYDFHGQSEGRGFSML
jgi:hypothetical protein